MMDKQTIEYKIVKTKDLKTMEKMTQFLLDEGWQLGGPMTELKTEDDEGNRFYHEMLKISINATAQQLEEARIIETTKLFEQKLADMDSKVKDLLELNSIELMCVDGKLYIKVGDKVLEGISPNEVLKLLKGSKHYPIDMKDEKITNAIDGVL